ncbi:MAG: class II fumarate hydratase [Zetaproteobacteria bacterium]|nr:class II fumarate hydratase [Zetaproteobacteria bacterium]
MNNTRIERDSMGEMHVPMDAMYGAQTARALANFPISGITFSRPFIKALGHIKSAAAKTNQTLGKLDKQRSEAIQIAAQEVIEGKLDHQFVLDIFQTGSGTSTNMNANEVIAFRANQIAPALTIHANDHVNMGQSSNDVIPTAIHIAAADLLQYTLTPALRHLHQILNAKCVQYADVLKIGRTHLMDATPITLGQEISSWARQIELAIERLQSSMPRLCELAQGGTAVGTGLNTHKEFGAQMATKLAEVYHIPFTEAENHFEAQAAQDAAVELSGHLKTVAVSLMKISNDIRLLNAGPRCGLGEISVPAVQPGSSIMPGKVNPVIAESMAQICAQVIGNDATITYGGASGLLDLNVMLPVIAHNLLQSETILASGCTMLANDCIRGLTANESRCQEQIEWSMSMVTSLAPVIGYDQAAKIAKQAVEEGKTVRQICLELEILPPEQLAKLLDPRSMLTAHSMQQG